MLEPVRGRPAFVGRDAERAALTGVVDSAAAGRPGLALLQGDAGGGKTRLLDEVLAALPPDTLVCRGAGVGFLGGRVPYAPLVAALRSLLSALPAADVDQVLGPGPRELARLLPELSAGDGAEPESDQTRLIASISYVLDRVAGLRPTVLVLDDLHNADVATLEVLAYVCAALHRQRLAVLVAYRPDEVSEILAEWLQDRQRAPGVVRVALDPMSVQETREHLAALVPRSRSADVPDLAARIHARSGGNPYAAEALLGAALSGEEAALPTTLRDALLRRTRACMPDTARMLRVVAAAGDRVPLHVLRQVADTAADLDAELDEAARAHLLVVDADETVSLRHALLAEALYADLLPGERTRLHRVLADVLERDEARPATVAEHASRAGDEPRALVWSWRAGQAAESVYAYDEALAQYDRVRRLWPRVPDAESLVGRDAVDVFTHAASVAALCDQDEVAVDILEQVRAWLRAEPQTSPVRLGLLEGKYARLLLECGRPDDALTAAREAVALVPADPPTPARATVVSGLVHILDWLGGGPEWEDLADEAVEVARATGDHEAVARALIVRATVRPDLPAVLDDAAEAVRLALDGSDPELVGQAYSNQVDCLQWHDRGRLGIEAATAGVSAVSERGLAIRYGSWLSAQAAEIAITYGWWTEADAYLRSALQHTRHVPGPNRDYALVNRARLAALRGLSEQVDDDLRDITHLPTVLEPLRGEARAEVALNRGDPGEALAVVAGLAGLLSPRLTAMATWVAWLGARALADLAEQPGQEPPAEESATVTDLVARSCTGDPVPGAVPAAFRALCAAELSRVAGQRAVQPWADAVAELDGSGRPYLAAYARFQLARTLVAVRDHAGAADALRVARQAAGRLGAEPLVAQLEGLARRTRIDLRAPLAVPAARMPTPGDPASTLTPRELEILGHLAAGRTNAEIARALVISVKTASVHVSNILRKLGASSRYEAAELAERFGPS